jgi:hypothetical protein
MFFGYKLLSKSSDDLGVNTDASDLWLKLAKALRMIHEKGHAIERLEVGKVKAPDVAEALNKVRVSEWLAEAHGFADGAFVEVP